MTIEAQNSNSRINEMNLAPSSSKMKVQGVDTRDISVPRIFNNLNLSLGRGDVPLKGKGKMSFCNPRPSTNSKKRILGEILGKRLSITNLRREAQKMQIKEGVLNQKWAKKSLIDQKWPTHVLLTHLEIQNCQIPLTHCLSK